MHWRRDSGQALADAPHEQRDVGALSPAVGVELVEHEEAQARAVADDLAVDLVLPRHEQLEHHEVGEQDVWRVVGDALAQLVALLPGVARESHRASARAVGRYFASSSNWLLASAFIG
jgi:hypothetical protein